MTTLEKVLELKRMGIPNSEIEIRLKNEEISPMEINDAMNQSKIKEAVSGEREYSTKGMIPSIMGGSEEEENSSSENGETYTPSSTKNQNEGYEDYSSESLPPQEYSNYPKKNEYPGFARDYEETTPVEEEFYENDYSDGGNYGRMNSETMIEVAEQVFSEKVKEIEKDLRTLKEFKTISAPIIEEFNERLKRIEKNFDKMQIAILERVGSFGRNIDSLKKEVEMVEDSFEKMNKNKK